MDYMEQALLLAERARGWSSPNPAVGAVLVSGEQIVGAGSTQPPGGPHAEVMALEMAGLRAAGCDLYVTLEPCSHFGRTPPCTTALIGAKVARVHVAMSDPSPWVNGGGLGALQAAGIPVTVGQRGEQARRLNEGYFKWVGSKRPFVTLKYAMTADGRTASRTGSSQWVTGAESRGWVARLRAQADAILVGIGTVLADDPLLTARPQEFGGDVDGPVHQPVRVVVDSLGRLPVTARVVGSPGGQTLVFVTDRAPAEAVEALRVAGAVVEVLPQENGRVNLAAAMDALGSRGVTSTLVEGGSTLAGSLIEAGLVDKVAVFIAPKIVGGDDASGAIGGEGKIWMADASELTEVEWTPLGRDMLLTGYLNQGDGANALGRESVFRHH